jgi:hypothetical protein
MQAGMGAGLETADKRGKCINHIPIPERVVRQRALRDAFYQSLQQHGVGVQQILLDLDMRKPAFVVEQLGAEALISARLLQVRAVAGTI